MHALCEIVISAEPVSNYSRPCIQTHLPVFAQQYSTVIFMDTLLQHTLQSVHLCNSWLVVLHTLNFISSWLATIDSKHSVVWQRCCSADRPSGRDREP